MKVFVNLIEHLADGKCQESKKLTTFSSEVIPSLKKLEAHQFQSFHTISKCFSDLT